MEPPADLASVGTLVPHSDEHYLAPKQSITSAWGKTSKGMTTGGSQDSPHPHLRRERVELLRANVVHAGAERRALAAAYTTLSMAVQDRWSLDPETAREAAAAAEAARDPAQQAAESIESPVVQPQDSCCSVM